MSECAIFFAAGLMERVWHEIEHLCEAAWDGLERSGLGLSYADHLERSPSGFSATYGYTYKVTGAFRGQKKPAHLMLAFDLCRPGPPTDWPPGSAALLLVGYGPSADDPWDLDMLAFGTDGLLKDPDVRADLIPTPGTDGRLLSYPDGEGDKVWSRRSWLFAVPFSALSGPAEVDQNVVRPVAGLMAREKPSVAPLLESGAIQWPTPQP